MTQSLTKGLDNHRLPQQLLLGCCYYPEHWDISSMREDIERIHGLGFNVIRMGEFSWSMYEKTEGQYDFSVLCKAIEIARELGISVILGTPTAAPPKWLTDRHPEVLCSNENGVVMHHGSRQHHNHTSEIYLDYCAKITEAMVKACRGYDNVIGWQIDNELNCERNESYSKSDHAAFREWIRKKYGTIDALNKAWGNVFWSLELGSFDEIECPMVTPKEKNPSCMTDYYLFLSDTVINYASVQTKIIRRYMPNAFITHNGCFDNLDYKKLTDECLDILGFDSYPIFDEQNGVGKSRERSYKMALTRACGDRFLILEQQAGPGGQRRYMLPSPKPGQIRLWTYQSIAHGAVGVLYFRYRTALFGAEQLWYGIYDHSCDENHRSREIRETAKELSRIGHLFLTKRQKNEVAIYSDYHNNCANKAEPFFANDTREIYVELMRNNINTDVINDAAVFDGYKVIIFPHVAIISKELLEAIERFTDGGGIAIFSARSGVKDENANYLPATYPGMIRDTVGCSVDWFTSLVSHDKQFVTMNGESYPLRTYYEILTPEGGEVIAEYGNGFAAEKPAIVKNGNAYYVGFFTTYSSRIYSDIVKKHISYTPPTCNDLEQVRLDGYVMYLNYGESAVEISGYDLIKEEIFDSIPPFGVVLVEEK